MVKKLLIERRFAIPCCEIKNEVNDCLEYFLYLAPNVDNYRNITFDFTESENALLSRMFEKFYRCYKTEFSKTDLNSEELNPNDTIAKKCIYLHTNSKTKEIEINCFLRHMRNAIAHGRVFFYPNDWIVFEDYKMRSDNLSARIICQIEDLKKWKEELCNTCSMENRN